MQAAWKNRPRIDDAERALLIRESDYRCGARQRGYTWGLDRATFRDLISAPCAYCGTTPSGGIDRIDNAEDYTPANAAPCCSICNFAKRDMAAADFVAWARRVAERHPK